MSKRDKPPKGGWLPPPGNTRGLAAPYSLKKGGGWKKKDLTTKEQKKLTRFQKAMKEADEEGRTHFEWK
jgi:hypothetical protein